MSNRRTPSGSASGFYGTRSSKSGPGRLPEKGLTNNSGTPARSQTCVPRRNSNFYGPGVLLNDLTGTEADYDSEGEVGECDFDFGNSPTTMAPCDRELSPEIPLHTPVSNFEFRGADHHSHRSSISTDNQNEVIPMLQQQQLILQRVLEGQKTLEERQNKIEDKLADLQSQMDKPSAVSPSSSSDGKRKRLVTRALSNKVYSVHKEAEKQFDTTQLFSSTINKEVKVLILKEVKSQPDCKFDEATINLKRCYENLRRTHIEQQDGKKDFAQEQAKRRKYRSRRERKFQRRSSVVSKGERERYWKYLSLMYVTEESDDPNNPNGLIEHKLPWRSPKLSQFMEVLDGRLSKKPQPACLVARKVRKIGTPSNCAPPENAPVWALAMDSSNKENTETHEDTGTSGTLNEDSVQDLDQ